MGSEIINICIAILITFMSIQFCKPLDGQWQQFLLGYRAKSLTAYLRERYASTDEEKAKRRQISAIEDANHQIMIIRALMDHSKSVSRQNGASSQIASHQSTASSQSASQQITASSSTDQSDLLNTRERAILADSMTSSVSSSILFQQVRKEVAGSFPVQPPHNILTKSLNSDMKEASSDDNISSEDD